MKSALQETFIIDVSFTRCNRMFGLTKQNGECYVSSCILKHLKKWSHLMWVSMPY